jgi:hypothetical protein
VPTAPGKVTADEIDTRSQNALEVFCDLLST